jgi:hypothetical protein
MTTGTGPVTEMVTMANTVLDDLAGDSSPAVAARIVGALLGAVTHRMEQMDPGDRAAATHTAMAVALRMREG